MNERKDNNRRECQICGRMIKAKNGLIAHHGYKRPGDGWQTASCMGARELPYSVSCDVIPRAIKSASDWLARDQARLAEVKINPPAELTFRRGSYSQESIQVPCPADFNPETSYRHHRYGGYDTLYDNMVYHLEQDIKSTAATVAYLKDRLERWTPRTRDFTLMAVLSFTTSCIVNEHTYQEVMDLRDFMSSHPSWALIPIKSGEAHETIGRLIDEAIFAQYPKLREVTHEDMKGLRGWDESLQYLSISVWEEKYGSTVTLTNTVYVHKEDTTNE